MKRLLKAWKERNMKQCGTYYCSQLPIQEFIIRGLKNE
jgi:hypothetical protein